MTVPPYLCERDGALCLNVKARPRAKSEELGGIVGNELKVKVTAPPVDSAANEALAGFLAGKLGCPRRSVTLVRGHTNSWWIMVEIRLAVWAACPTSRAGCWATRPRFYRRSPPTWYEMKRSAAGAAIFSR